MIFIHYFLIKPLYLTGVWLLVRIEEQTTLGHMFKVVGLCLQSLLTTPHSSTNIIGRTCIFNQGINKNAFPKIVFKSRLVQFCQNKHQPKLDQLD